MMFNFLCLVGPGILQQHDEDSDDEGIPVCNGLLCYVCLLGLDRVLVPKWILKNFVVS